MPPRDNSINDKSFQKFLHNDSYYQHIFKKTEKIISVVFYILNNIEVEKKSETHTSNLAAKAHFAHENALRTLEAKPASAKEILEQSQEKWERLAQGLLEYETLTGEEIKRVMAGEPPHVDEDDVGGGAGTEAEPSVAAIPKTKPRKKPKGEGGLEPEPTA